MMAGLEIPAKAIREQLASAVDVIVQLERLRTGARVVGSISEVLGVEGDRVVMNPLFTRVYGEDPGSSPDGRGSDPSRPEGSYLQSSGVQPEFAEKLAKHGVALDPRIMELPAG